MTLWVKPTIDEQKIPKKAGYGALEQGIVAQNNSLKKDMAVIGLKGH